MFNKYEKLHQTFMIVRVILKVNHNLQKKSKYLILIHNPDSKKIQKSQITTQMCVQKATCGLAKFDIFEPFLIAKFMS
jgi:hypothetical protein